MSLHTCTLEEQRQVSYKENSDVNIVSVRHCHGFDLQCFWARGSVPDFMKFLSFIEKLLSGASATRPAFDAFPPLIIYTELSTAPHL